MPNFCNSLADDDCVTGKEGNPYCGCAPEVEMYHWIPPHKSWINQHSLMLCEYKEPRQLMPAQLGDGGSEWQQRCDWQSTLWITRHNHHYRNGLAGTTITTKNEERLDQLIHTNWWRRVNEMDAELDVGVQCTETTAVIHRVQQSVCKAGFTDAHAGTKRPPAAYQSLVGPAQYWQWHILRPHHHWWREVVSPLHLKLKWQTTEWHHSGYPAMNTHISMQSNV